MLQGSAHEAYIANHESLWETKSRIDLAVAHLIVFKNCGKRAI